jgi:hypothetical protein
MGCFRDASLLRAPSPSRTGTSPHAEQDLVVAGLEDVEEVLSSCRVRELTHQGSQNFPPHFLRIL